MALAGRHRRPERSVVDVYFVSVASRAVRSEVDRWVAANDSGEIEFITVDERWVAVHGHRNQFVEVAGTATRQGAPLAHDLDLALAMTREEGRFSRGGPHADA
jgi:hypothetical protein